MISFTVPGEPKGKARPIVTKKGIAFTPKTTISYENWVKQCYIFTSEGQKYDSEPLRARIRAYYSIPSSKSQKQKNLMNSGKIRPTKKPDTDNIAKIVLDSLNGLAFKDDSQIVELIVEKYYSENPQVEVEIEEVQGNE